MKQMLIKIFWPILSFFETGEQSANYKESHRFVLNIVGTLFLFLSMVSAWAGYTSGAVGALIPVVVFFCVGLVALVLGTLGSNAAVTKIWGIK
ncbi:MAG: hypothetical protein IBX50_09385 [Marinospirillum sp.]|uniref:hypothetical protein n=1 Tax=Marinospirillum sp. TaxID=2183934 RepID=UPI0019ED5491|nr:hypothetical protein [Marinospirillum sp.]MBE0506914.1 hypothetical protein [Marinospirillum sp.]